MRVDSSYLLSGVDVVAGDAVTTALLGGRAVEVGVDTDAVASDTLGRLDVVDERPFLWDKATTGAADIGTTGGLFAAPKGLRFTADEATSAAYTFERAAPTESMDVAATMHVAGMPAVASGVKSVTVTNGGAYTTTPTVTLVGGGGSGATAVAVMQTGTWKRATITEQGKYDPDIPPTAWLDPPLATDIVVVEGVLREDDLGEYFGLEQVLVFAENRTPHPSLVFSETNRAEGGVTASGTVEFDDAKPLSIFSIVVTASGYGYESAPSVVIGGDGDATAVATTAQKPAAAASLVVDGSPDGVAAIIRGGVDIGGALAASAATLSGGISIGGGAAIAGSVTAGEGGFASLWESSFGRAKVGYPQPTFPPASNISLDVRDGIRAGDDIHARDGLYVGDPGNNIFGLGAHGGHLRTYGNLEINPNNPVRESAQGRIFLTTTANTTDTKFQLYTATDGLHIDRGGSESKTGVHDINLDENVKVTGNMTANGAITAHNGTVATVLSGVSFVNPARSDELANHTTETSFKVAGTTTPLSITFPANTLAVGQLYRVTAAGGFACASNGTLSLNLRLPSALMINGGLALTAGAASSWMIQGDLYVESIGASGKLQLSNCQHGMRTTFQMPVPWEFTVNTTADIVITSNATWTVAHAGNNSRLWRLTLERLR